MEFGYSVDHDFYGVNITFQCFSQFLDVNVIFPQSVLSSGACRERATISFQVCGNKNPHFTHFTLVHLSLVSSLSESWVSSAPGHHSKLNYTFKPGNIPSMLIHHFQRNCNFVDTKSYLAPFHVWNPFRHLKYSISRNSLLYVFAIEPCWLPVRFLIFHFENENMVCRINQLQNYFK